ncbi:unnamed protein product [Bemisia tabaci]|uniref:5-formyltetrahydrofolate cyclo-ligase n=1 Tax=Bemisia tabaci TaxID=7038 RepID=A0A9P0AGV2_BEMTA|nr:unnamed protein product [Bemisia tabaci]
MDLNHFVFSLLCAMLYSGRAFCDLEEEKTKLREKMTGLLKKMSNGSRSFESDMAIFKLINLPNLIRMRRSIGVYLNTELEPHTEKLIANILSSGKRCYIPRRNGTGMDMVILRSMEEYAELKVNELGFKEPNLHEFRENALSDGGVDVLIMPGLAFTLNGRRLGRGGGMYEKYLESIRPRFNPTLIGLAFEVQILREIPHDEHDIKLDTVVHSKYRGSAMF